ncbi:MAG: methyltransferase domain-containing protein, partial [Acidobacteria bacterium]|nr:methyltransferase domain-containing protein [Acidobacteriota bacterium]
EEGLSNSLSNLRSGKWNKIDLLGSLRYSEEGRRARVAVAGLRTAYLVRRMFRMPVVGYILRSLEILLSLPRVVVNMERFEAFTNARLTALQKGTPRRAAVPPVPAAASGNDQPPAMDQRMRDRLDALERSLRDMANVLFLSESELLEAPVSRAGTTGAEAALDSAVQSMRETVLGRAAGTVTAPGAARTNSFPDPRTDELAERIDRLVDQCVENTERLRAAWERENEQIERRLEAEIAVREALQGDVARSGMAWQERMAEETAARETLSLELHGLLGRFDERVAQLRAAWERENEQLDGRLKAEIAVREALTFESQARYEESRATAVSLRAELQRLDAQMTEEVKAREWLGGHFNAEFEKRHELEGRFNELERAAHQARNDLSYADWRISTFVAEARKRLPQPLDEKQVEQIVREYDEHSLDSLYASFEDIFRGSREDIKARQSVYLPYIREAKAGSSKAPVIDLGCGRGEWLELLREEGLTAQGVDSNRVMVERCGELGLQVKLSDALAHLREMKDGSAGCVTGFHIVEHMPWVDLIQLLDETLRVLRPGGLAIFETPNPNNILVGSREFFNDPTHVKPLPSRVLKFLAEARGLCKVQVLELHPYPKSCSFEGDGKGVAQQLNEYFYGPQDYSVIGRKA